MTFASPLWLAALAAVPLLVGLYVVAQRRRRRYAVRFTALETVAAVAASVRQRRRHLPAALTLLALCALTLAIARPQVSVAVPVERASIVLVTDTSGSMNASDVDPTRMEAARRAATSFVDEVPESQRVGLVGFSEVASVLQSPTDDHDAVRAAIASRAEGATATGDALRAALDQLRDEQAIDPEGGRPPSAIVLLSDGRRTAGQDPLPVAQEARRLGVPVYTISLGTPDGRLEDPRNPFGGGQAVPPDPETMRAIARASGGQAYDVRDADRLDEIYERLGSQLGTREEDREVTAAFAGGGLLLLGAAVALALRGRTRLPG
jgi:Ca-activated chloride channel homolog